MLPPRPVASGGGEQPHDGEHRQRLAGAALADDTDGLARRAASRSMPWTISRSPLALDRRRRRVRSRTCSRGAHRSGRPPRGSPRDRLQPQRPGRHGQRLGQPQRAGAGRDAPRTRASRAPVPAGMAPGSPCAVCQPMSAKAIASLVSVGAPKSLMVGQSTPGQPLRAASPSASGCRSRPRSTTSVSTPAAATASATVRAVSAVSVATRSAPARPGCRGRNARQVRRRGTAPCRSLFGRRQRVVRLGQQVREQPPRRTWPAAASRPSAS